MTEFILQIDKNNIFNQIFEPLANKFSEVIKNNSGLVGTKLIDNNNQDDFIEAIKDFSKIENLEENALRSRKKISENFSTEKILSDFVEVYQNL